MSEYDDEGEEDDNDPQSQDQFKFDRLGLFFKAESVVYKQN